MILHNEPSFLIYFGDAKDRCVKSSNTLNPEYLLELKNKLNLEKLIFLKQVHGIKGLTISDSSQAKFSLNILDKEGDFLVTNLRNIGLGILTADCLPVIFYDPVNHVVAIAHAGWKSLVAGIIPNVIETMQKEFNTKPINLNTFFGACAKVCCYQVQKDFIHNLDNSTFSDQVIFNKDNKIFFDIPRFATLQLTELGIPSKNIKKNYKSCTVCDTRFHSHRRNGKEAGRQATIVALK